MTFSQPFPKIDPVWKLTPTSPRVSEGLPELLKAASEAQCRLTETKPYSDSDRGRAVLRMMDALNELIEVCVAVAKMARDV